jgi:hypothetical protein
MTTPTYATISITEMYGPETRIELLSEHDTAEAAVAAAQAHDPDYDASVDARRLAHNQASPTYARAMRVHRAYPFDARDHEETQAYWEAKGYTVIVADAWPRGRVLVLAEIDAHA